MRSWFLFIAAAAFGTALLAQVTPGLSIDIIIHEPNATDVGGYIAAQTVVNPNYDPLQPNGEPQFLPAYGNGGGISDELDSISGEFYALGGTTTHDLAVLRNDTGAAIDIDTASAVYGGAGFALASSRPAHDVPNAPESTSPDGSAVSIIYPYDPATINVPNGSSVAVFLIATKWRQSLDTSPREYIWTFNFDDGAATTYTVEANLLVPKVGGSNGGGCVSDPDGFPTGLWILATGGLVAIVTRQKVLKKLKA
ncbi:MAG: hypothetical protein KDB82_10080 [Planctomycetes bacterium]|nr:hypothetical protein [Planctomycetota bacterium]